MGWARTFSSFKCSLLHSQHLPEQQKEIHPNDMEMGRVQVWGMRFSVLSTRSCQRPQSPSCQGRWLQMGNQSYLCAGESRLSQTASSPKAAQNRGFSPLSPLTHFNLLHYTQCDWKRDFSSLDFDCFRNLQQSNSMLFSSFQRQPKVRGLWLPVCVGGGVPDGRFQFRVTQDVAKSGCFHRGAFTGMKLGLSMKSSLYHEILI